jgi:hypothetical protein
MDTPYLGDLPPGTKRCDVCQEPINSAARKCVHCGSDQGWRSRLTISSTMLSLVIALLSVLTVAVPVIATLWTPQNSDLVLAFQGTTADDVFVLVSNQGIRPGSVRAGSFSVKDGGTLVLHIAGLPKNVPKIIEPGKSELVTLYSDSLYESTSSIDACMLQLLGTDFLGRPTDKTIDVECTRSLSFISAHKQPRPARPAPDE